MAEVAAGVDALQRVLRSAREGRSRAGVRITALRDVESLTRAATLFATVWGVDPTSPPMAPGLLVALAHSGNYVVGAYDGDRLVAACAAFWHDPARRALHSHIAGVLPEAAGRGIGRALKLHQAAWCAERGGDEITWTFDPLVARNAHVNVTSLGVRAVSYLPDLYGPMTDGLNVGHPTDRLLVSWDVSAVRLPRSLPASVDGAALVVESGVPRPVLELSGDWTTCSVAVPDDIETLRRLDRDGALLWRLAQRAVLGGLLGGGWQIIGFDTSRGYILERSDADAPAGN
ncbi:MAG: GNAT family N-acetyltransferase [Propionicimonas sp.]